MCPDRVWFNPWERPETSPWRNFWEESFWNNCILASVNHDGAGNHFHYNNHHNSCHRS